MGSRASATDELHDELLARYEKDVPVRWRNYLPRNLPLDFPVSNQPLDLAGAITCRAVSIKH